MKYVVFETRLKLCFSADREYATVTTRKVISTQESRNVKILDLFQELHHNFNFLKTRYENIRMVKYKKKKISKHKKHDEIQ